MLATVCRDGPQVAVGRYKSSLTGAVTSHGTRLDESRPTSRDVRTVAYSASARCPRLRLRLLTPLLPTSTYSQLAGWMSHGLFFEVRRCRDVTRNHFLASQADFPLWNLLPPPPPGNTDDSRIICSSEHVTRYWLSWGCGTFPGKPKRCLQIRWLKNY